MGCLEHQVHLGQRVRREQGVHQGFLGPLAMASLAWKGRRETRACPGYQGCLETKGNQGWRANQGTWAQMDSLDLQEYKAPWGSQENMAYLA